MSSSPPRGRRLPGRRTVRMLLIWYFVTLAGLAASTWFELPGALTHALRVVTFVLAVIAAICAGRMVTRAQESIPFRERPAIAGRGAGAFVFVALSIFLALCTYFIAPRSWPTSVDAALDMLDEQMGERDKRQLVYIGYDDLSDLRPGLATSIGRQFGMASGNNRLLRDCDAEYVHADTCSSVILSRYWKRLRAALPPAQRASLEALEAKMERVRLKRDQFRDVPLQDLAAFLNAEIRTQLPEGERLTIHCEPADAAAPVSASWHALGSVSLREALGNLAAAAGVRTRKRPPDLLLEIDGREPSWNFPDTQS